MNSPIHPDEIRKLLGGYATGTLTPEEQQALFAAALDDQELFDALAREQSLHDLLRDPSARAHVLAAIDEKPSRWYQRFWRPLAIASAAAAGLVVAGVYLNRPAPKPELVAQVTQAPPPAPPPVVIPEPAAAPAAATARRQKIAAAAKPAEPATPASSVIDSKDARDVAAPAVSGAPPMALQKAEAMFATASTLGMKWTILRQRDGGDFVEVAADQLAAGDTVKLRLIPNEDGFLTIAEAGSTVVNAAPVRRQQPFESPTITSTQAARKLLTVQLARVAGPVRTMNGLLQQQSATDAQERSNYVLKTDSAPQEPVSIQIPLIFK